MIRIIEREKVSCFCAFTFAVYLHILQKNISFVDIIIYYESRENIKK